MKCGSEVRVEGYVVNQIEIEQGHKYRDFVSELWDEQHVDACRRLD